ncbi:MAG: NAD(P)-binding protein, partial [Nitrospirae bacterium]|nr:NAD(P)-binding protein [Nitrospirota bacterium]
MPKSFNKDMPAIVLGGGLTGLAAAYSLTKAGIRTELFEQGTEVGGLCRTIRSGGYSFDLGGHRFFTTKPEIDIFIRNLMAGELISVSRNSTIFLRG